MSSSGPGGSLAVRLAEARVLDDIASAALAAMTEVAGVVRAGLAVTMVGGRQLRFTASDRVDADPASWCLIDAYDELPLNDAVRTGRDIVLTTEETFAAAYPDLAARQVGSGARGIVALALTASGQRLGGLVAYCDDEPDLAALDTVRDLVAQALDRSLAQPGDEAASEVGHPLPADETAPSLARRFLRSTLSTWGAPDEVVDAALLCASELVTNVVMHERRPSVITVDRAEEALLVELRHNVSSPGMQHRRVREIDPLDIAGRGLALVEAVAADWGAETRDGRTRVWFTIAAG